MQHATTVLGSGHMTVSISDTIILNDMTQMNFHSWEQDKKSTFLDQLIMGLIRKCFLLLQNFWDELLLVWVLSSSR